MLAASLGDVVYFSGVAVVAAGVLILEPVLVRRGWDLPRRGSVRLLGNGLLFIWVGLILQLVFALVLGAILLAWFTWLFRRPPGGAGVTSRRGEAAVERYLRSLSSVVPVVRPRAERGETGPFTIPRIGTYEDVDGRWSAHLAIGPTVRFVLRPGGRAELRAEDVHHHELTSRGDEVSLGDVHAALTAMSARGIVDRTPDGTYAVTVVGEPPVRS